MTNLSNFESWFASEIANGLIDIKLAVVPGKNVSSEAVEREILASELALASGAFRDMPSAKSAIPEEVIALMNNTNVAFASTTA
jgi:hypothetical protein